MAAEPSVRAALAALTAPIVWDPHPRGPDPVPGVILATPNAAEARAETARGAACRDGAALAGAGDSLATVEAAGASLAAVEAAGASLAAVEAAGDSLAAVEAAARALLARWRAVNVCVTRGAKGALMVGGNGPALAVPAAHVAAGDPCGAGDAFAAAAAARLAAGALPSEAVRAAVNAASDFVAAGGAAGAAVRSEPPIADVVERVRAQGGTVVATGGCFDLLHAGHVRMLDAARALGDCLVVCLNSDASVRRLKGPDRPLVGQDDRAAVLEALASVDAVAVFEEDDPRAILGALRPDVWVKGGDYALADLPEADTLAQWGGRAVVVPYVAGRSTSRLIEVARVG